MKITHDREVDALYVYFTKGKIAKTLKLGPNFLADVDKKNNIVGLEVLDASKYLARKKDRVQISIGNKSLFLPALAR